MAAKPAPDGDPNEAVVSVANRNNLQIAASDLLDPGFLELVRFGIRPADDPVITGSVRAIARAVQDQSGGRLPDHRVGIEVLQGAGLMQPPSENYGKRDLVELDPRRRHFRRRELRVDVKVLIECAVRTLHSCKESQRAHGHCLLACR